MHIPNNPPAFPRPYAGDAGMSLRDWFAGQALLGMGLWMPSFTPDGVAIPEARNGHNLCLSYAQNYRAQWAYAQADAMLQARIDKPGE